MNRKNLVTLLASAGAAIGSLLLMLCARPAAAQYDWFPNNATINYAVPSGYADVGYSSYGNYSAKTNPTSPTVNFITGALASGYLVGFNHSTINVTGGAVQSVLYAFDSSTFNISGGQVRQLIAQDSSRVSISFVTGDLSTQALDNSAVSITGGVFGSANGVSFRIAGNANMSFTGVGLSETLVGADSVYGGTDYRLTGILQSGDDVTGKIVNVATGSSTPSFLLSGAAAPEPGALSLALIGLSSLLVVRRRMAHSGKV